jgi:hypothetical protein
MDMDDDASSVGGYKASVRRRGMDIDDSEDDHGRYGDGGAGDRRGPPGGGFPEEEEPLEADMDDVRRLGVVWVRERGTSDILQWEDDLVSDVFDKLEQQVSTHQSWICPCYEVLMTRTAEDGGSSKGRSADERGGAFQAGARDDGDGAGQVLGPIIHPYQVVEGGSVCPKATASAHHWTVRAAGAMQATG